ncbi:MAG: type II toxin-antitoxin system mRNA interferase toxin, RelE/StbE family [Akkermansiaceae bacterium]
MEVRRSKSFVRAYASLNSRQQEQVEMAVARFAEDRSNPALRNHRLKGKMRGHHSFSAAWNLRIIYREEDGFVVIILIDVGTHNQVY